MKGTYHHFQVVKSAQQLQNIVCSKWPIEAANENSRSSTTKNMQVEKNIKPKANQTFSSCIQLNHKERSGDVHLWSTQTKIQYQTTKLLKPTFSVCVFVCSSKSPILRTTREQFTNNSKFTKEIVRDEGWNRFSYPSPELEKNQTHR